MPIESTNLIFLLIPSEADEILVRICPPIVVMSVMAAPEGEANYEDNRRQPHGHHGHLNLAAAVVLGEH
jgi:hypothetical protein